LSLCGNRHGARLSKLAERLTDHDGGSLQRPREETVILGEPRGPKTELRLSPQQTIGAVEASGLKLARLIELPPYHYAAVFEPPPTRKQ
jgi:hypothetical protein